MREEALELCRLLDLVTISVCGEHSDFSVGWKVYPKFRGGNSTFYPFDYLSGGLSLVISAPVVVGVRECGCSRVPRFVLEDVVGWGAVVGRLRGVLDEVLL